MYDMSPCTGWSSGGALLAYIVLEGGTPLAGKVEFCIPPVALVARVVRDELENHAGSCEKYHHPNLYSDVLLSQTIRSNYGSKRSKRSKTLKSFRSFKLIKIKSSASSFLAICFLNAAIILSVRMKLHSSPKYETNFSKCFLCKIFSEKMSSFSCNKNSV